jgi:hypothetical protein
MIGISLSSNNNSQYSIISDLIIIIMLEQYLPSCATNSKKYYICYYSASRNPNATNLNCFYYDFFIVFGCTDLMMQILNWICRLRELAWKTIELIDKKYSLRWCWAIKRNNNNKLKAIMCDTLSPRRCLFYPRAILHSYIYGIFLFLSLSPNLDLFYSVGRRNKCDVSLLSLSLSLSLSYDYGYYFQSKTKKRSYHYTYRSFLFFFCYKCVCVCVCSAVQHEMHFKLCSAMHSFYSNDKYIQRVMASYANVQIKTR